MIILSAMPICDEKYIAFPPKIVYKWQNNNEFGFNIEAMKLLSELALFSFKNTR